MTYHFFSCVGDCRLRNPGYRVASALPHCAYGEYYAGSVRGTVACDGLLGFAPPHEALLILVNGRV